MLKQLTLAAVALTFTSAAFAQQALKPEQAIKYRQAAYSFASWNMGKIKANVEGANYNKAEVIAAAQAIASVANSGLGALYIPGSDKDVGAVKTKVTPEAFAADKQQDLAKVAIAFGKEANELAKVAATGDAAAVKAQFGKVGGTCKACHDDFRQK
ncbi:cytochrome c [Betaproteobacteria bacterium]|nr:cytochrome c [Betaproteobacteria bacterium]GHU14975.1 cytochrome c [Betaproteobacteria bacterium]GHU46052.1 cytochrome c [Betaproteobacteria bacterium]